MRDASYLCRRRETALCENGRVHKKLRITSLYNGFYDTNEYTGDEIYGSRVRIPHKAVTVFRLGFDKMPLSNWEGVNDVSIIDTGDKSGYLILSLHRHVTDSTLRTPG